MNMKRIDPREQFSKKLATWTARFWFLHMVLTAAMCIVEPSVSDAAVYMAICSSIVMLINVWAYTHNSVYEKAILAAMEKTKKVRFTWKKSTGNAEEADSDEMETDEDADPEKGESNG